MGTFSIWHWIVVAIFGGLGLVALFGSGRATLRYLSGRGIYSGK